VKDTAGKVEAVALVVGQGEKTVNAAEMTDWTSAKSSSPRIEAAKLRALARATLPA